MHSTIESSTRPDGAPPQLDSTVQSIEPGSAPPKGNAEDAGPDIQDPMAHMSEADRFGLKGFSFLMNNYPDYAALVAGSDVTSLGFDLNSPE